MASSLPVEHNLLVPEVTRHATAPDLHKVALHKPKAITKAPKSPRLAHVSDGETQAFRHLAHSMVSRTLAHENEYRRMKCPDPSNGDWKLLKRQDALSIYKRRSSKREQAQSKRPMVLCVGSVPGTLEDVLYGLHAKTREEMQATTPLVSRDYLDCALLAMLEGGSHLDPYRQLSLKWHLTGGIGDAKLARRRDLCVLESMGIATDAQGERYAYHLIKSVEFAECPPPPKESGAVRASMMLCCIYRQRSGSQMLDMYAKGMFDLGGNVHALLLNKASCAMMLTLPGAMASAEAKRLTLLTMRKADGITASSTAYDELSAVDLEKLDLEDFDLGLGRSIVAEGTSAPPLTFARWLSKAKRRSRPKRQQACCVCAKKPSIVGASHPSCGVCLQSVCSKCRVNRRLVAQSHPVAITCCKSCLLEAKRLEVDPRDPCPMLPM